MAASLRSVCRCSRILFSTASQHKPGSSLNCRGTWISRVLQSCSICVSVNVATRNVQLLSTARIRHLPSITVADRKGTAFGFSCFPPESPAKSASRGTALSNNIISSCRTVCTSCIVSSPQKLKRAQKVAPDDLESHLDQGAGLKHSLGEDLDDATQDEKTEIPEKKENIKTIPNLITCLRMASAPVLGYLVLCESYLWAFGIFFCAGISDLLDGYIARNFENQTSVLGTVLDPLADKLLVSVLTISLTCVGLIPLPLTLLIVSRDLSLIAGGFYIRYRSLPPPMTLSRYFDISHATAKLSPTFISKVNTGFQLTLVAGSLAAPVFGFVDHGLLQALWYATAATTFASGFDYLCSWKKYVTLLEKDQKEL